LRWQDGQTLLASHAWEESRAGPEPLHCHSSRVPPACCAALLQNLSPLLQPFCLSPARRRHEGLGSPVCPALPGGCRGAAACSAPGSGVSLREPPSLRPRGRAPYSPATAWPELHLCSSGREGRGCFWQGRWAAAGPPRPVGYCHVARSHASSIETLPLPLMLLPPSTLLCCRPSGPSLPPIRKIWPHRLPLSMARAAPWMAG